MRKILTIVMLLFVTLAPFLTSAQSENRLSLLSVDIWPEYDQPAVLMIYRITMAPTTVFPTTISISIPSDSRINAVAIVDANQSLLSIPYDSAIRGKWEVISAKIDSPQVQLEYYAPLVKDGTTRHILFEWAGDYAVDKLDVNFLKPFGAEGVSLSVAPTNTSPGQDGLINYQVQANNLDVGKPFVLKVDYQRQMDDLSISSLPVQAASTPGPDTPGRSSMNDILPWVLGGIGVVLIVAGVFGFLIWQRGGQRTPKRKKHVTQQTGKEDDDIYCSHCGRRAQPGDIFCRTCGTRLTR
jgi:hypothetical protein